MNQILFTGDEDYGNSKKMPEYKPTRPNNQKVHKEKEVVEIRKIVIFFAIAIAILGICYIVGSMYAKKNINANVEANATPSVEISENTASNTAEISVKHIRGIKQITYQWNDENEIVLNENNQKNVVEEVELIKGSNTLKVTVTEENGQTVSYEKKFTIGNVPTITIESVDNGVKLTTYAQDIIDTIKYCWDDGEYAVYSIGKESYSGVITVPKGRHTLKIVVTDKNGVPAEKTTTVTGATAPVINVALGSKSGELYFVINIQDEEQLKNVTIKLNGVEKVNTQVSGSTYYLELKVEDGLNQLEISATNNNGLSSTDSKNYTKN